ncbi:hypothetical protein VPJ68_02010, partial [Parabacteroides distasonis]
MKRFTISEDAESAFETGKRLGGLHCWRRLCRQKVTVSRGSLIPSVRISPMGHGGTPRNVCAFSETSIRSATATSET